MRNYSGNLHVSFIFIFAFFHSLRVAYLKSELTNFFYNFVYLRSSIIKFTPKIDIFPSKNFNLVKSGISLEIISCQKSCLKIGGRTGPFMTSYLPFIDIGKAAKAGRKNWLKRNPDNVRLLSANY